MRRRQNFLVFAATVVLAFAAPALFGHWPALAGEAYHLRLGWVVTPADLVSVMFTKPGLAPHAGKTYIPELTHFAGTPAEMTALATGELDCAALAYSTFALAIENAGMTDLRVIADVFQNGVPGYHTNAFVVRKDSPINTVEDLKGQDPGVEPDRQRDRHGLARYAREATPAGQARRYDHRSPLPG